MLLFSAVTAFAAAPYGVLKLVASSAVQVSNVVSFPALVANAAGASKWLALGIAAADLAPVVGAIIVGTVVANLASDAIKRAAQSYFSPQKGVTGVQGIQVGYYTTSWPPVDNFTFPSNPNTFLGYHSGSGSDTLAYNDIQAAVGSYSVSAMGTHPNGWSGYYGVKSSTGMWFWCLYSPSSTPPDSIGTFVPYTKESLAADLQTTIAAGNPAALGLIKGALDEINLNIANMSASLSSTVKAQAQTLLANAITAGQKTAVDGMTAPTPDDLATAQATKDASSLTSSDIQTGVQAALQAQALSAVQLQAAMDAALKLNPALSQAQVQAAMSAAIVANPGLTQAQAQTAMTAALATLPAGLTQSQVQAAMSAALAANPAGGATQAQVQAAVKAALDDSSGLVEPVETETLIPTKLNLTNVLSSFMASVNSMPLLDTLRGLTINVGGTSSLCLALPSSLGGQQCFDAGGMSGTLNMIGTAFLSLTTLFSFVSIFRG